MLILYPGQKVLILENPYQSWTVKSIGVIEKIEHQPQLASSESIPLYYVSVRQPKGGFYTCILLASQFEPIE